MGIFMIQPQRMKALASSFEHGGDQYVVVSRPLSRPRTFQRLTPAELAVVEGLLEGSSMRELARERAVSERTIGNQIANIYRKLGIVSRHELVALVARPPDPSVM